jgi:hypothetical protein
MTVPSSTSRDQQAGNGTTTAFTIPFRILDQTHLRVLFTIAGVTTEKTLTTDYTVSGVGDAAATVTFLVAPSSSTTITFLRDVPATQETDYVPNDPFPAESHEQALDKLTMLVQQLREEVARAITIPATVSGVDTELPTPVGTRLWGWDALAAAPRYFTPAEIATAVAYAAMHYDTFTASAAQTDFTLDADPGSLGNLDVSIDGVTQVNGPDFTYSGTTLTFAVAMAGGEKVLARYGEALPAGITSALAVLFQQSGTGAVTRTMQDKAREFVSVKDFGALGDAATDDTIAVQAALDAHDNVYFPPGTYVVSALTFAGKRLFGDGATLFWKSGAVGPLITVSSGGAELRGIKFDGNAAGQTITSSALKMDGDQASVIACEFRDFHGRVLTFNGENSLVAHSYFHDTGVAANCNCVELTNRGGQVLGNRFITIGDGHVVRVGYQSVVRDCDGFVIANNFVQTTLHGTFTCELGANRGVIIGNTIDGADAAYKTETDASVYDVTIAFNTVMNLTDAGPIDLNSTGVNYIGNRHYNLPNGGPFFGDLGRCEGNFFRDVGTMGVWTAGDRVDFINNTIIDPDVVLAGQIITVEGGCRVAGNRIVDTASDDLRQFDRPQQPRHRLPEPSGDGGRRRHEHGRGELRVRWRHPGEGHRRRRPDDLSAQSEHSRRHRGGRGYGRSRHHLRRRRGAGHHPRHRQQFAGHDGQGRHRQSRARRRLRHADVRPSHHVGVQRHQLVRVVALLTLIGSSPSRSILSLIWCTRCRLIL